MTTTQSIPFMSSQTLRETFLRYFKEHGHTIVASSSLVPAKDPTLLFTNAGMVQFKDVFLGTESRDYTKASSSQRCVRAGGKHNDLERVGYTARHHTFFEMLGNFSFGDYFKREAIQFAWQFLTEILKLPTEKLWVTVYEKDHEAEAIWLNEMKIDPTRFSRCGEDDNFWSMGPTGPCGPCTEIFYDHGNTIPGGPPGSETADGDRYIEIWNLVFMQYDRSAEGTLTPLPKPSVDTGMGLERIAAVMQGVHNNYDTDLFQPLIQFVSSLSTDPNKAHFSLQVIADHIRSASFLITDGVMPSNEGRGYVLRRIIRRAIRHGNKIGMPHPFFHRLVKPLISIMGAAYPELAASRTQIEKVLRQEEEQFSITLSQGIKLFEEAIELLNTNTIPGETIFKLYDTYGFPVDLTADMARERGLTLDEAGFEKAMDVQRDRSRQASQFHMNQAILPSLDAPTKFIGHDPSHDLKAPEPARVIAIYRESQFTNTLSQGEKGTVILDRTPFYAESGGQVGDQGIISKTDGARFKVFDTIKQGHSHLHLGQLEAGSLSVGDTISAQIDVTRRMATILNHTATHLLHQVLKEVLGEHVMQKGSLVEPDRLRFDFSHSTPLTSQEITAIEQAVNRQIRANHESIVEVTTPEEAIAQGAVALFGEKYGSKVRVVQFGPSKELCGGTHAEHTGDIGLFKITTETGVASGIRRIEAVTGEKALQFIEKKEANYQSALKEANEKQGQLDKEIEQLQLKLAEMTAHALLPQALPCGNMQVLSTKATGLDGKGLKLVIDYLKSHLGSSVIVLATVKQGKVGIVAGVTDNLVSHLHAKEIVNLVATQVGGRGGGRADLAEAGGNQPEHLEKALASVYPWVQSKLASQSNLN